MHSRAARRSVHHHAVVCAAGVLYYQKPRSHRDFSPLTARSTTTTLLASLPRTPTRPLSRRMQSRFDKWQLSEELFMPCMQHQPYKPPYMPNTCTPKDTANIEAYGPTFMQQFRPLINTAGTKNGAFLDACIIHGSTNSSIDGLTNMQAFEAWLAGGKQWWVMTCNGSDEAGPCDPSPICAPYK